MTNLVALFQRAHNKVVALARIDDQIATMVVQHERLQDEVRAVQNEINQEFERALKFNQAPAKLPPTVGAAAATAPQSSALANQSAVAPINPPPNGDSLKNEINFSAEVIPLART